MLPFVDKRRKGWITSKPMTFYEAALRILESEGRPLHFLEITEKSIAQNLLSHIGKTPEQTMLCRLAAMARRTRDRKLTVTAKDTFALVDWALPEDAEALANTGAPEPHPEESLPPLRPVERHPDPRSDNARSFGRTERRRRGDDEDRGKRRRFPPISEVVFEILSEVGQPLKPEEITQRAKERELASNELSREHILNALLEDNQRRIDAGRRPQFIFLASTDQLALERSLPSESPAQEVQAALAQAAGAFRPADRLEGSDSAPALAAKAAVKDARRHIVRGLRRRLSELDSGGFEKAVVRMMHGHGFRDIKVAKRSKDGPLMTARKREGSVELRFAVRLLKGNPLVDRKMISELRRDLGHYSAHLGLLATSGDLRGDGRAEAHAQGPLVLLWCGDALGEKFLEARAAVHVTQVELFELDDSYFSAARRESEEARSRREERLRERQEGGERAAEAPESDEALGEEPAAADSDELPNGDSEGRPSEGDSSSPERRRRRRRRRGRRPRVAGEAGPGQAQGLPPATGEAPSAPAAKPEEP
jgi:hypothetical protein